MSLRYRSQADTLVVGQEEPSRSELLTENVTLLLEMVHDLELLLVNPAGQRDQDEAEPERNHDHRVSEHHEGRAESGVENVVQPRMSVLSIELLDNTGARMGFWRATVSCNPEWTCI